MLTVLEIIPCYKLILIEICIKAFTNFETQIGRLNYLDFIDWSIAYVKNRYGTRIVN